jgi:hypothetical protein
VNTASIIETQAWYRRNNMLQGDVDLRPFVDSSFAEWAVQQLGPYPGGRACPSAG